MWYVITNPITWATIFVCIFATIHEKQDTNPDSQELMTILVILIVFGGFLLTLDDKTISALVLLAL